MRRATSLRVGHAAPEAGASLGDADADTSPGGSGAPLVALQPGTWASRPSGSPESHARRSPMPKLPDSSGWNWHARVRPLVRAETKRSP